MRVIGSGGGAYASQSWDLRGELEFCGQPDSLLDGLMGGGEPECSVMICIKAEPDILKRYRQYSRALTSLFQPTITFRTSRSIKGEQLC
jgi:hypothetical protein